ncbi:unnamed protein product [Notodromas monacha]|uniref:NF-X1-type domain-containing protein n=2 Tax=Notodromas monacha TaxID=399045 RepID=A0A7R9GGN9_9CRUS|nr:unnamed protein product [Notodromas monacha]CAG0920410.1 unnamed protein product [Notodromas monacha]
MDTNFFFQIGVCAGSDSYYPWAALVVGWGAGFTYLCLHFLMLKIKVDDPLDAIAVHFGGGFFGLLAVPFLMRNGIFFNPSLEAAIVLLWNLIGAAAFITWSGGLCFILFATLKLMNMLRVPRETELRGMDLIKHNEPAYPQTAWEEAETGPYSSAAIAVTVAANDKFFQQILITEQIYSGLLSKEDSSADCKRMMRERKYPMSLGALRELAESEDPATVFAVINEKSGFPLALEDERLIDNSERMLYILKVLCKAMELHGFEFTVGRVISLILHSKFLDSSLLQFNLSTLMSMCNSKPTDVRDILRCEIALFDLLVRRCPADKAMNVEACVNSVKMVVLDLENILGADIELGPTLNRVRENLTILRRTVEKPGHSIDKRNAFRGKSHLDEAPEDFRTLSVLPTLDDLLGNEEPFLRSNISSGRYLNADHYLDVQFRLMKEDFMKPLREGVAEVMKGMENKCDIFGARRKIQEVRIYEKGVITGTDYDRIGVTLELKFSLRNLGRVEWKNSKRLIFGSLLCLTNDNFKSVLFASVAERNVDDLKRGIIRIRPESSKFDLNAWTRGPEFLVVESTAFFEAYRHVLSSLQMISLDQYPLKKYVVDLKRSMSLPKNILDHQDSESQVFPLKCKGRQCIVNPFTDQWPEPEELGLEEAQFRAFKVGLCHEFAIIQGPPGTGKTFIGLKLVETILYRREKYNIVDDGPILVVCFTNHALDQFLEGISRFTRKILRIGGRSKSVLLAPFTVRNARLLQSKQNAFALQASPDMKDQLNNLEKRLGEFESLKKGISSGAGILALQTLRFYGIEIPSCFPSNFSLAKWLNFLPYAKMSENFFHEILDKEKNLLFAEGKITTRFPTEYKGNYANNDHDGVADAVDLDIDDEATAEAHRREIESIYDTDRNATPSITAERASESIRRHCEISIISIENAVAQAKMDVQKIADLLDDFYNPYNESISLFPWEGSSRNGYAVPRPQDLMEAEWRLENWSMMRFKMEEDSVFLKVPANLDLVEPPEKLVGPKINWINARLENRWLIYRYWANRFVRIVQSKIDASLEEYRQLVERYKEAQDGDLIQYARSLDIVGMTTTGAARNMSLVHNMRSKILVVEEAAEVLESHIVCCLTSHCEHLIQIGDQQQLRPTTTVYDLAKNYGLDVSLFERMVKNRVPYARLRQQHRMRPEISNLIKLNVYEDLQDHDSVTLYDDVLGVAKNVFFIEHNAPEESNEDLKSKSNEVEAEFLLSLCRYLLLQGYEREQITILTGYSGQLFVFKKLIADFPTCEDVKISLVDSYQGEENDIILLSLVRSNLEGNIGFLKTENRVNVALSRAKKGLFIIGNMDALVSASELWRKIRDVLVKENQIGKALPLRCQNHPDQVISVSKSSEFPVTGGCTKMCNKVIDSCGHLCQRPCHVKDKTHESEENLCQQPSMCSEDPCPPCKEPITELLLTCGHTVMKTLCHLLEAGDVICEAKCEKTLKCGHRCQRKCQEPCGDCRVKVQKIIPDCSHFVIVECSEVSENIHCQKKCGKVLTCGHKCAEKCSSSCTTRCTVMMDIAGKDGRCGHQVRLPCHIITSGKILSMEEEMDYCDHPCGSLLSCGHVCSGKCSECFQGRIHVPCDEPCERKLVCGHVCKAACGFNCPPCREPCGHSCPHSPCADLCSEPCSPCWEECKCGCRHHKPCQRKCFAECGRSDDKCNEPCEKVLGCRHKCVGLCGEICPPCRECTGDTVAFFDLAKNAVNNEPDARFIVLVQCQHVFEVDGLDRWMRMPMEIIGPKVCPRCETPIVLSRRYKEEVNFARRKVTAGGDGSGHSPFLLAKGKKKRTMEKKQLDGIQADNICNRIDLLGALASLILDLNPSFYTSWLDSRLRKVARSVISRKDKLNGSDLEAVSAEIQRFRFFILLDAMRRKTHKLEEKLFISQFVNKLSDVDIFTEAKEAESRRLFREAEYPCDIAEERLALYPTAFEQGLWYACPNEHVYSVNADSGISGQQTKCPECRYDGSSNSVTFELDNTRGSAAAAAWFEDYTSVANLDGFTVTDAEDLLNPIFEW